MVPSSSLPPPDEFTTVDDVVRMAIEDLYPNHKIPDEDNNVRKGVQHKAPDHLILDGKIAIERKSRNATDNSQFYEKLQEVAAAQGKPFFAVGRINHSAVIRQLPDPDDAKRKVTDFMMRQTMKTMRNSQKKFAEYGRYVPDPSRSSVLIISDNTTILGSTGTAEYFIGRKMGAINPDDDQTPDIDAIVYIKNPLYTLDVSRSYWFKALIRSAISQEKKLNVGIFVAALHHRVGHYAPFFQAARNFKNCRFQPVQI